ncbi:MAG: MauE/DoxX family redox-associated membrane protein [Acidimicrobiia bacterium]
MPLLSGPFLAVASLLVVAGVMKVYRPRFTAGALRAARLPATNGVVRLLGVVEVGVGAAAIVTGSPLWALATGVFYVCFALFVVYALRSGIPISSCGCFGSPDTPPSVGHVVLNAAAAVVALAVAMSPVGSWVGLPGTDTGTAVAFLLFSAASVYLLYAVVNVLPQRTGVNRETPVQLASARRAAGE